MTDLSTAWKLDIAGAAQAISERSLSPVALTEMMLDRIATIDPKLLSYVTVTKEDALKSAAIAQGEIATGKYKSLLHGIPIAIKDIYDTAGVRTTACSKVRAAYVPESDGTVVRKFREAGAVILGKVTTHEFAFGFDSHPTKNAWNLDHIPSGSSGGSGAAIAAGLCFAATGSDTGGSIRAPAAANGIAGIKPTYGRVSKAGVAVLSWSLDHAGPMARTVRDLDGGSGSAWSAHQRRPGSGLPCGTDWRYPRASARGTHELLQRRCSACRRGSGRQGHPPPRIAWREGHPGRRPGFGWSPRLHAGNRDVGGCRLSPGVLAREA